MYVINQILFKEFIVFNVQLIIVVNVFIIKEQLP